jgi:ATP-dependent RNA helicase DHX37/DHR1
MKSMHIDAVINFPFPTPPERSALQKAEKTLMYLGALVRGEGVMAEKRISEMGRSMSLFPIGPRYARMLVSGRQHGCLPYVVAVVAALSVGDPFVYEESLFAEHEDDEDDMDVDDGLGKERLREKRRAFFRSQQVE